MQLARAQRDLDRLTRLQGRKAHDLDGDDTGRAGIDLGVSGVPETFVIDRRGRVRYRQVGAITPEVWANTIAPLMSRLRDES